MPAPVSITGIVAFSLTKSIRLLLPRGIIRSTYSRAFSSCVVSSRPAGRRERIFLSMPYFSRTDLIMPAIAVFELMASLPPFKMQAFPDFMHRENTSKVTLGRAS